MVTPRSANARANVEGQLYGSVGPAQIAAAAAERDILLEPRNIILDEPIRRLDKYDVTVRFAENVEATIVLWVVPPRDAEADEADAGPEDDQASPAEDQDEPAGTGEPESEAPGGTAL